MGDSIECPDCEGKIVIHTTVEEAEVSLAGKLFEAISSSHKKESTEREEIHSIECPHCGANCQYRD